MQEHSGKVNEQLSIDERNSFFTSLWATVSNLYFIHKTCMCEPELLSIIYLRSDLPKYGKNVANLRNKKDHLAQQIKNLAETKTLPPINGLVRWTFNPHYEAKDFVFNIQVFTIDPMLKGFRVPIPEGIE